MTDERPIGYWVKSVDRLLEEAFALTLTERRIARRHWQVMNLLAADAHSGARIADELAPFLGGEAVSVPEVLADLQRQGWVTDEPYALTQDGQEALRGLRAEVAALRQRATEGLSEDDYLTTVTTLRRMSENLERPPSRGVARLAPL
ncbi:MarR family winged helix-turn-helix transcriptional regulator [Cryptosporangium minutisporangium]|uniref:MarR family winged helix-turn-helix transcriptional regulator n=1 Tax=Cryptosporangium minutisporangium TaxID=113569 RepID=A0ABP6T6W0_9ACTN